MATEVVRDMADTIIGNKDMEDLGSDTSLATVILVDDSRSPLEDTSTYTLNCDSGYSHDVERWMKGDVSAAPPVADPSCRNRLDPVSPSMYCALWYLAAMMFPFASVNNATCQSQANELAGRIWIQNMTTKLHIGSFVNKLDAVFTNAGCVCFQVRSRLRRMAEEQALMDVFATAMDAVLVIYAIGFLVLSLCQASIIGF